MPVSHKWLETADLPDDLEPLRDRELEYLCQVWFERKKILGEAVQVIAFNTRLAREWAIETGIIEGLYTLDRGTTHTLTERGIDSAWISHGSTNRDPELVARIVQAHSEVLEGLFAFVKSERVLGTAYVRELHAALLRYQDTITVFNQFGEPFETQLHKGAWKTLPNNPRRPDGATHEFCPPEHVASEMDRLILMHHQHMERGVSSFVEAAWLHHAFTQVHPFQDGNGRVARALASMVLIKDGLYPLVINRDDREKYIEALEVADEGDLSRLTAMFARIQKRALTSAIAMAADTRPVSSVEEAIEVTRDMLLDLGKVIPAEYLLANHTADVLGQIVAYEVDAVRVKFTLDITQVNSGFQAEVGSIDSFTELIAVAAGYHYEANRSIYHAATVLNLQAPRRSSSVVIAFHGVGPVFTGLLAVVAYFKTEGIPGAIPLSEDIFRITHAEPLPEAEKRFSKWLDETLIRGFAEWRRSLL